MEDTILHTLEHHWKLLATIWFLSSAIGSMPTPNGGKTTGSWWYRWLFGTLHTAAGNLPRVMATLFPGVLSKTILSSNSESSKSK